MTDITSENERLRRVANPVSGAPESPDADPRHQALVSFAELFYFAYRDFTSDPDAVLETYDFGRAHHRVLHFVYRNPGLKVAELLDILRITKQSLARVLKELKEKGFILHRTGPDDLRERRLYATAKGTRLAQKLSVLQVKRIEAALAQAGPRADATVQAFLLAMIEQADRHRVADVVKFRSGETDPDDNGDVA